MKNIHQVAIAPLGELGFAQRIAVRTILLLFSPLIEIENEETLTETSEPLIFAFNHNNSIETILVAAVLLYKRRGAKVRFVVDWVYGSIPLVRWFVRQVEPIYVYNKRAKLSLLEAARNRSNRKAVLDQISESLSNRDSVGLFPEGRRNSNPNTLRAGRTGIGKVAIDSAVPVLPIGIDFPCRIRLGRIPKIGRVILRVGSKLEFAEELGAAKMVAASTELSQKHKEKLLIFFDKTVVHKVMLELARLSGKNYPYDPPAIPRLAD